VTVTLVLFDLLTTDLTATLLLLNGFLWIMFNVRVICKIALYAKLLGVGLAIQTVKTVKVTRLSVCAVKTVRDIRLSDCNTVGLASQTGMSRLSEN
jgi:hypothetical protein